MSLTSKNTPRRVRRVKPRRRGILASILVSTLLVVATVATSAYIYSNSLLTNFNENRQTVESGIDPDLDAFEDGELNVLLLGSDARVEEGESSERSDTMMLVHIPESQDEMYIISIMRDLWVEIPGHGEGKINGALEAGGYPLAIETVESVVGIEIDHLAIIDFEGFKDLTTALDGVTINNPIAFSAGQANPSFFPEGEIKLEGTDALRFVRERKAFSDGDYQRVKNQQIFLSAIASEMLNSGTLSSPDKVADIVDSFSPFMTVDEGLDAQTLIGYGLGMRKIRPSNIEMLTLPNGGVGTTPGGASIIWQDEAAVARMRQAMETGTMAEFVQELKAQEDADDPQGSASTTEEVTN